MRLGPLVYKNAGLRYCMNSPLFLPCLMRVTKPKYALQQTCLRGFDILPHESHRRYWNLFHTLINVLFLRYIFV
jgi:hypothetical protein